MAGSPIRASTVRRLSGTLSILIVAILGTLTLLGLASCGKQDDDPAGARALWDKVNAGAGFKAWRRAPGYPERAPSFTAHGNAVDIYVSPEVTSALEGKQKVTSWPVGSIIVKESYAGDTRKLVALMEKRSDGWFWAEVDDDGDTLFSGRPTLCLECHERRAAYSDWVYAFELPR